MLKKLQEKHKAMESKTIQSLQLLEERRNKFKIHRDLCAIENTLLSLQVISKLTFVYIPERACLSRYNSPAKQLSQYRN